MRHKFKEGFIFRFKKGFTLMELLVAMAIIGILAGIVIVSLNVSKQKARATAGEETLNSLINAIVLCQNDGGILNAPSGAISTNQTGTGGNRICNKGETSSYPNLNNGWVWDVPSATDDGDPQIEARCPAPKCGNATLYGHVEPLGGVYRENDPPSYDKPTIITDRTAYSSSATSPSSIQVNITVTNGYARTAFVKKLPSGGTQRCSSLEGVKWICTISNPRATTTYQLYVYDSNMNPSDSVNFAWTVT